MKCVDDGHIEPITVTTISLYLIIWLFMIFSGSKHERMPLRKRFGSNKEVIVETKVHFKGFFNTS